MAKKNTTWRRRAGAALCAVTLGTGGALLTAVPATAADYFVADEAAFLAAIADANLNAGPDVINVTLAVNTTFDYNGPLPVTDELIINGALGPGRLTLESINNNGIDVGAVPFELNGADVLGNVGHGISGTGTTMVLNDVDVSDSTGSGVNLDGGSLSAVGLVANDTGSVGVGATGAITAFNLHTVTANGNAARGISLDTPSVTSATLIDIGIDNSGVIGLYLGADGSGSLTDVTVTDSGDTGIFALGWDSLTFTDVDADSNGTAGVGGGIHYTSHEADGVGTFLRVTADDNEGVGIEALTDGANATLTMTTVSATNNGSTGMYIEADNGGTTFALDDLTVDLNGDNGMDFTAGGSVGTISNVEASNSFFNGLNLQSSGGAGSITATDLNSHDNGASGYAFNPSTGSLIDVSAGFATDNNVLFVPTYGGGIVASVDDADLNISDFQITSNEAQFGGGIGIDEIVNGGTVDITTTLVNRNEATTAPLASGGGIYVGLIADLDSRFTLSDSTIDVNDSDVFGGGIWLDTVGNDTVIAPVSITRTTVSGNTAQFAGGIGIPFLSGIAGNAFILDSSTVSGNQASDAAGLAVQSHAVATVTPNVYVVNSTFSGNIATTSAGGMLFNSGSNPPLSVAVEHSTVTLNDGGGTAGGIQLADDVEFDISNTIVQGNIGGDDLVADPAAAIDTAYNLVGTPDALFAAALAGDVGNQVGVNALLGPLQLNGGPTFTHLPSASSPAVDRGDPVTTFFPLLDQRGSPRVIDRVDIGAVERAAVILPVSGSDPSGTVNTALVLLVLGAGALAVARIRRNESPAS